MSRHCEHELGSDRRTCPSSDSTSETTNQRTKMGFLNKIANKEKIDKIAELIAPYAKLVDIDTDNGFNMIVLLNGETTTTQVELMRVDFSSNNETNEYNITIYGASSKNQWLDSLLKDFVIGKKIEISQAQSMMIKKYYMQLR